MKLKFTHKLILFVGSLLLIVIGAAILLASLQFNAIPIRAEGEGFLTSTRFLLLISGLIVVAFGVFCLTLPGKTKQAKLEFITQKTETGELKISTQAIEAIISKSFARQDAVMLLSSGVQPLRGGIEVNLQVSMANNINVPGAVSEIQKHIKKTLKDTLNIEAKEIKIAVEKADLAFASTNEEKLSLPLEPEIRAEDIKDKPYH